MNMHTICRQAGLIVFTTAEYILITQGWLPLLSHHHQLWFPVTPILLHN